MVKRKKQQKNIAGLLLSELGFCQHYFSSSLTRAGLPFLDLRLRIRRGPSNPPVCVRVKPLETVIWIRALQIKLGDVDVDVDSHILRSSWVFWFSHPSPNKGKPLSGLNSPSAAHVFINMRTLCKHMASTVQGWATNPTLPFGPFFITEACISLNIILYTQHFFNINLNTHNLLYPWFIDVSRW